MRWLGCALAASGVEVEAASAWRRAGLAARRAEGLAERPRAEAAAFLGLGLGTAEKVPIRATKASSLQCETPPRGRGAARLSANYRHILFGTFRFAYC